MLNLFLVLKYYKDMTDNNTLRIVKGYIAHCMQKQGYNEWERTLLQSPEPKALETLKLIGERFESAYYNSFDNMIETFEITAPDAEDNFNSVAQVLFQNYAPDGINWGRIVGLIVFASRLSIKALEDDHLEIVDSIVTWTYNILQSPSLTNWFNNHNGWNGFVEFYRQPGNGDGFSMSGFFKIGVATVGGAAALINFFRS